MSDLHDFEQLRASDAPVVFTRGESTLRVKFNGRTGTRLLVLFHPAYPPALRTRHPFQPFLPLEIPQLAISDPTLEANDVLATGWYLGRKGENLPSKINQLILEISAFFGITRRIYLGGSSGGFAALHYGYLDATSVAIAACPQIDLDRYANSHVRRWKSFADPAADAASTAAGLSGVDLMAQYRGAFSNTVVVLVSPGDRDHLFGQIVPWLAAIDPERRSQVVLDSRYAGIAGHSGSVPPQSYGPWVRAAVASEKGTADDIMRIHHELQNFARSTKSMPEKPQAPGFAPEDLRMARLLAEHSARNTGDDRA